MTQNLTLERLKQLVDYSPVTGEFWLLQSKSKQLVNSLPYLLGQTPNGAGYREAMLEGKAYRLHVLAYFYMTGNWPPKGMLVDHIDRNTLNNAWDNLRLLTKTENIRNQSPTKSTTASGHTGVFEKISKSGKLRYIAHIRVDKALKHLGTYDSLAEALAVRQEAEKTYFATTHGGQT